LRKTILVAVILLAIPAAAGGQPSFTAEGEELLRKLTAQQFDGRLPDAGLKPWLTGLLGNLAQIDWSTADCGDEGGGPDPSAPPGNAAQSDPSSDSAGSDLDSPLCTEALAQFYGRDGKPSLDRYVVVQLLVGTDRSGVNRDASRYGATAVSVFVFDGSAVRTLSRLGDLPAALAAMK